MRPGANFGSYRVLEPLGRGGMAAVYRAYEPALDRYVALKVLPTESLADPAFTARFRREAKVIAALEHRHIVPIYAYGIDDGVPWMAMRLVPGGALSALLRRGPISLDRTVALLAEVATALDFAHDHGVLHRDVKPQNVLLDEEGHAYLADFGIARMMEGTAAVTRSGVVTGTPLYMSPEQARGEKVDHRTDIYALGIVAYEMLTGRVPFSADTPVAVLMKHILDPLPLPPAHQVPETALRAILKCVAKDRGDRWSSARRFVDALGNAASRSAAWASAQPTLTQAGRPPRAPRSGLPVPGVVALAVAVGGLLYFGLDPRSPAPVATPRAPAPEPSPVTRAPSPSVPPVRPSPAAKPVPDAPPAARRRAGPAPPTASLHLPLPAEPAAAAPTPSAESVAVSRPPAPSTAAPPTSTPAPTLAPPVLADELAALVGRWNGLVRQKKNPFIHRELERPVRTECRRLDGPPRVLCRSDWGILEDWLVVRQDPVTSHYLYQDSEGMQARGTRAGDRIVYEGDRQFDGRSVAWRLTHVSRGRDAFALEMKWSRDARDWHTVYEASFERSP